MQTSYSKETHNKSIIFNVACQTTSLVQVRQKGNIILLYSLYNTMHSLIKRIKMVKGFAI
jgi:hypothetical protein